MILRRASVRYLARHPWQFGLAMLGVALGVAMVVSIDLANESARRAFISSAQTLSGKATHQIIGGSRGLPEALYRTLRVDLGVDQATPVVEGYVVAPEFNRTFQLIGIDSFSAVSFHGYLSGTDRERGTLRLLTDPDAFLMTAANAEKMGMHSGDTLKVEFGGVQHRLVLAGLIDAPDAFNRQALATVLFTDIATAQELVGSPGYLSRIDLRISDDVQGKVLLKRIRDHLPMGAIIVGADSRTRTLQQMTLAFQTNLTGLSLLALVVGMFLIYNTITFSVIQRRNYIGILRALGVSRREVFTMILREALIITCLGTVAGLVLGYVLGQGFLHLVTRTINDLYFLMSVSDLHVSWWSVVKSVILGVGVTLLAALVPAVEATRTPPAAVMQRSVLETHRRRIIFPVTLTGIVIVCLGIGLLSIPSVNLALSYTGMFTLIAGFVLLVPLGVIILIHVVQPLLGALAGILGKLAARDLVASLSRTTIAVAALAVAIAVTIGVGIMIVSFRSAVENWLDQYLRADVYITVPGANHTSTTPAINPALIHDLSSIQDVASISTGRRIDIMVAGKMTEVHVIDMNADNFRAYRFTSGDADSIWPLFQKGGVIISEPYAFHHHISAGDSVTLRTDHGLQSFPVAGIFYDYGSDQGVVTMDRPVYDRYWNDRSVTTLGLYVNQGVNVATLIDTVNQTTANRQSILVRSNKTLRAASLQIFDRTFAITTVLRLLAIVVAFIGILSALMALQLEKAYEYAVLRANGLTPWQVWGMTTLQTGLMGFCAGILALPLGIILALVLIYVINQRSFGWSMQLSLEPALMLQAVLLAVIAAVLAGLYPAYRMARVIPLHALRME